MYTRQKFKSLDRTLVVDTRVREVTQTHNTVESVQSHSVGIPTDGIYQQRSLIVGAKGIELPETLGFLMITTAEPILMQIGSSRITIEGQFVLTGIMPPVVLISDVDQRVELIQY